MDTEVTFPKVTLCCSGVHLQYRTSIPAYLHLYIGRDRGFHATIERGLSPTFSAALRPKWQIIHAHSLSRRFSTLVRPKILAHAEHSDISPLPSQSVTARGPFRSYLLQIETFTNQPNHLSQSITVRTVFRLFVLPIETNSKPGGSQTRLHIDINRNVRALDMQNLES